MARKSRKSGNAQPVTDPALGEVVPGGVLPRRSLHEQVVEEIGLRIVRGDFADTGMLPTEPRLAAS